MLRPAYRIVIGDHVVDTTNEPKASTAVEVVVRLDLDTPADGFTIVQGQVGGLRAAPDDDVSIDLGYADDDNGVVRVLTGTVVGVEPGLEHKRIAGLSLGNALLRTFVDKTFEDTTAGDIVRALAGEAGVDVERAEDGLQLPAYVVDGRRDAARHIRDLGYLCGFDSYLTPEGKLVFEPLTGNRTVHVLKYGEHVLSAELVRTQPRAGTVQTWGESQGSGGDESWAWLTKDFTALRGSAGSGAPTLLVESGALRTGRAAASAATAISDALTANSIRGRVRVQGRPQLRLGDLVRLEKFPDRAGVDELDGNYQIRAVRHRLDKTGGFVTEVDFRSLTGAAAGSAG
jgi:phage protein D